MPNYRCGAGLTPEVWRDVMEENEELAAEAFAKADDWNSAEYRYATGTEEFVTVKGPEGTSVFSIQTNTHVTYTALAAQTHQNRP